MQDPTSTITACILARDEERRIEDALGSLHGWTEQLLVIDDESEDATAEIARRHGARALTAPRSVHFDAARNLAIEQAASNDQRRMVVTAKSVQRDRDE